MEITDEQIQKYREIKKIRNQKYYEKHREKLATNAKNKYHENKLKPKVMIDCDLCKCCVSKESWRDHIMTKKHQSKIKEDKMSE